MLSISRHRRVSLCRHPGSTFAGDPSSNTSATSKDGIPASNRPLRGACSRAAARKQSARADSTVMTTFLPFLP